MYKLTPKTGHGCTWFAEAIFDKLVKATSADGFETIVAIDNYDITRL